VYSGYHNPLQTIKMETTIPISIYLVLPLIGIILYVYVLQQLDEQMKTLKFATKLFITFASIGGLIILWLTVVFWRWSGLASLGSAVLIFIAPFIMAFISYDSYKNRLQLPEYKLFKLSLGFYILIPIVIMTSFILDK